MDNAKARDMREMFCREYIVDMNASQAALRAGYAKISAPQQASKLLKLPEIIDRINELMAKRVERTDLHADGVLKELSKIGYADIRTIFKEDGTIKPMNEWPEELSRACAGLEVVETFETVGREKVWTGYIKRIKFWDKPKALELMGKNQKLFTDRVEHTGTLTLEALVAGSNRLEGSK